MRKIKLFALAAFAMLSTNVFAQSYSNDTFTYTLAGGEVTIDGLNETQKGVITTVAIPATVPCDGVNKPVTAIGASAFADQAQITTVTIAKSVATIGASAFYGCTKLASVTFADDSELAAIGDFAFGSTPSLTAISFEKCAKMKDFDQGAGYQYPFNANNAGAAAKNNYLTSITLNGETTDLGVALAKLPNLETQNIKDTKIASLGALALDGNTKITSLELPATCLAVVATALQGTVVATLTINSDQTGTTQAIGAAGAVYGTTLDKLTTLKFVGEFKGTIGAAAFTNNTKLASVTFGDVSGTITAGAFNQTASAIKTLTIGKVSGTLGAASFAVAAASTITIGDITSTATCAAGSIALAGAATTTTVGAIDKNIAGLFTGNTGNLTVGAISKAVPVTSFGTPAKLTIAALPTGGSITGDYAAADAILTELTISGAIADANALYGFMKCSKLAKVSLLGLAVNGAVKAAAFGVSGGDPEYLAGNANTADDDGIKLHVYYSPEGITAGTNDCPFDDEAFSDAAGTDVKLHTTLAVKTAETTAGLKRVVYGLPVVEVTESITLAKKDGDWYYGKFYADGQNFKIAKGDAIVYSAYVDASDATIYMDQLRIVKGFYIVNNGQAVVIKSKSAGPVSAVSTEDTHTMRTVSGAGTIINAIQHTNACGGNTILDANPGKNVWAMANPEKYNLTWKKFGATTTLPDNTLYIVTDPVNAGDRLNVVWLDGSEEATAIQTVKKANAEKGAIYNLAGQKVNASYKGVVIKDGKKYIQK